MGNRFREKVTEEGLDADTRRAADEPTPASGTVDAEGVDEVAEEHDAPVKGGHMARGVAKVLGGDILADKLVLRQIPLLLLCLVFLLLLVANRYRVENLSREKMATEERINELREHRIQVQERYQKTVRMSQIAEDLKGSGVGITSGPPYEI